MFLLAFDFFRQCWEWHKEQMIEIWWHLRLVLWYVGEISCLVCGLPSTSSFRVPIITYFTILCFVAVLSPAEIGVLLLLLHIWGAFTLQQLLHKSCTISSHRAHARNIQLDYVFCFSVALQYTWSIQHGPHRAEHLFSSQKYSKLHKIFACIISNSLAGALRVHDSILFPSYWFSLFWRAVCQGPAWPAPPFCVHYTVLPVFPRGRRRPSFQTVTHTCCWFPISSWFKALPPGHWRWIVSSPAW